MERQRKWNRIFAFGLMLCLVAVLSLSTLFITIHAEHDCTGEGCEICHEIEGCIAAVYRMAEAMGPGAFSLFGASLFLFCLTLTWADEGRCPETLVALKIRLNN